MRVMAFFMVVVVLSAASLPEAEDALRQANNAAKKGQLDQAKPLYQLAAEASTDPGLVAFNRGRWHFERGEFLQAEQDFQRCLDDVDAPVDRRAKALYNWGVCLLARGKTAKVYRTAIVCFSQSAELTREGEQLHSDAMHNLELAKLFWLQARAKETKPPLAKEVPPEAPELIPEPQRNRTNRNEEPDPVETQGGQTTAQLVPEKPKSQPGQTPQQTNQKAPGTGGKPVILDPVRGIPPTPSEARQLLQETTERIARDRRSIARLVAGPDRPDVRDW